MGSTVKRFDTKKTYAGRDVKRTTVNHARTADKGRPMRPQREVRKNVR